MDNKQIITKVSEKVVTFHMIFILVVCILFGIINVLDGNKGVGFAIIGCGIVVTVVNILTRNNLPQSSRGFILSIVQLLIIIIMSISKHELQDMYALMLASMIVAAIYYNKTCLYTHWIIMDIVSIGGILFKDIVYGKAEFSSLIKGIAGLNVGAFIIIILIKYSLGYIKDAKEAQEKAEKLMEDVQNHIREAEVLS